MNSFFEDKKRTYNEVKKDINEKVAFPGTKVLKES